MIGHIFTSLALISGTITDFDRREVPNWITLGLIASGFAIAVLTSVHTLSFMPFIESVIGFAVAWVLQALMFYTGQWGGADGKILMGMGAIFGIPLSLNPLPFFVAFLIIGLFAGALYGVLYLIILVFIKRKTILPEIRTTLSEPMTLKIRKYALSTIIVVLVLTVLVTNIVTIMLSFVIIFGYFTFLMYKVARTIERVAYIKEIQTSKLVPGDWIDEPVTLGKRVLVDPEKLKTGLEPKHIALIKKHKIKTVVVKEGIPFVPSFLLGYAATFIFHGRVAEYFSYLF